MTTGQSLADGAVGIALLHLETGDMDTAFQVLEQAITAGVTIADNASLYYGAPAFAYVLAAFDHPGLENAKAVAAAGTEIVIRHRLEAAHRRIDQRLRPHYAEFDLIRGLTGLGVALRRIGASDSLRDVLAYLVRLTEPLDGLPGWWCSTSRNRDQPVTGGHSNHGMAHGITGPLALLALSMLDGLEVDGQRTAITRICQWLDTWEQHAEGGIWWPEVLTLDELYSGLTHQPGPLRPSWCYGTPGIARAQQLAGRALSDTARQRNAEVAFAACVNDPMQLGRLTGRGLCHGTGGVVTVGRRITDDALTPVPTAPLVSLHRRTAAEDDEPTGFLDGTAGADLALRESRTGTKPPWDACLLLC
ncbi:lanthionine synthetase C family protein [Streptosporangium saharense]|uniref:lanthionine synthetase C family protein n=1 Tax=Streptosporangium saharense TaxID=1706840 RepID=UPI003685969A